MGGKVVGALVAVLVGAGAAVLFTVVLLRVWGA